MFFEIGSDSILFDGLEIFSEKELCEEYMGKFLGISITLKGVAGRTFDEAKSMLRRIIGKEAQRFQLLMESSYLTDIERQQYNTLININQKGVFTIKDEVFLLTLS